MDLDRIAKIQSALAKWLALYVCGTLVLVSVVYTTLHVVGRYALNIPVPGTYELVGLFLVPITYLALAYAWGIKGTFVAANVLLIRIKGKLRKAMEIFIHLCALFFFAGLLGYGSLFGFTGALWSFNIQERYGTMGGFTVIVWPFKAMVVFGFLLMAIGVILDLIKICQKKGNQ